MYFDFNLDRFTGRITTVLKLTPWSDDVPQNLAL